MKRDWIIAISVFVYVAVVQNLSEFYDMGAKAGHIIWQKATFWWIHDWARYAIPPVLALGWAANKMGVMRVTLRAIAFSYLLDCYKRFRPGGNKSGWELEVLSIAACMVISMIVEYFQRRKEYPDPVKVKGFGKD